MKKSERIKKIEELFRYRKLPILLETLDKKRRKKVNNNLITVQNAIYNLDNYLESKWILKAKKIDGYWTEINNSLQAFHIENNDLEDLTGHIKRYQLHETQLRENKLPTRLNPEYYYYYKSCDVRLLRRLLYKENPEIQKKWPATDWRYYDLITEINDDIEDYNEDQSTINGNAFLISIYQYGLENTHKKFLKLMREIQNKLIERFALIEDENRLQIYMWTTERIIETRFLLDKTVKKLSNKKLNKRAKLLKHLDLKELYKFRKKNI